ncbi:uncharacterized protein B0T15DRAFT_496050 [Chaetomium strumarium]|uniref:Heterokaryon incompatibility domain-containing protein n=1 Tax=Chaetomium strumarium TaxID=1170767 RepID=A0AAJ0LZK7_9PEZI|nr:hypothetical protein B0T15DRAFT_496050 [Chaetomium strumarium]
MKLYVVSPDCAPNDQCLRINGAGWGLLEQDIADTQVLQLHPSEHADFICVSYSWGRGRCPSPFHPPFEVSDRTLPALTATIAQRPTCHRIWIDAFCVPPPSNPHLRAATLESMGFIYSRAAEVIVVVSSQALPVLQYITTTKDWVTRAWTYQEAVNARQLHFTTTTTISAAAAAGSGVLVDSMQLFSRLGHALALLAKTAPKERKRYPRLSAFEDVMCDRAVAAYLERSALQVMTVMEERTQTWPDDHFYAMMGAISTEPARASGAESACEAFMALCEQKGDWSFVFTSARRDGKIGGTRWRPTKEGGEGLKPIIKLPSWGGGLKGEWKDGCLVLEHIVVLGLGTAAHEVGAWIRWWLEGFDPRRYGSDAKLGPAAFEALRELGFSGSSEYLATENGLVFPQNPVPPSAQVEVLVTAEIRWSPGAPALVRYHGDTGTDPGLFFYEPAVFGEMPKLLAVHRPTAVSLS